MIQWHLEKLNIEDLTEHEYNPRIMTRHQSKHLKKSIEDFGLSEKPIVNQDGEIIGGHQRIKILKEMGYKEIECWIPDIFMSHEQVNELCIRLNKNTGDWDYDILANVWDEEDLYSYGFTELELGKIQDIEVEEEKEESEKQKNKKMCPSCGHEF